MSLVTQSIVTAAAMALGQNGLDDRVDARQAACLALNVYYEARGESVLGQEAVAHVVLNRAESSRYPDDICGVVSQGASRGICQFSWWCHATSTPSTERPSFRRALRIAIEAISGRSEDPTRGALFFHAKRLGVPSWTQGLRQTAVIGEHRFLRRR